MTAPEWFALGFIAGAATLAVLHRWSPRHPAIPFDGTNAASRRLAALQGHMDKGGRNDTYQIAKRPPDPPAQRSIPGVQLPGGARWPDPQPGEVLVLGLEEVPFGMVQPTAPWPRGPDGEPIVCRCGAKNWDAHAAEVHARWCTAPGHQPLPGPGGPVRPPPRKP